jgi:hypothetical protein
MQGRRRLLALGIAGAVVLAAGGVYAIAAGGSSSSPRSFAQRLLNAPNSRFMTGQARTALQIFATGTTNFGTPAPLQDSLDAAATQPVSARAALRTVAAAASTPSNVRVNDPAADHVQVDQTTQSESTIAVSGAHVAVGYNDSQHSLLALTAASDLTGYSWSDDGGATWNDGGDIPNAPGQNNFGDPWLTSGPDGTMYYSTLAFDAIKGLLVDVAHSTNGGRTWTTPVVASPDLGPNGFQFDDKPAITSGLTPDGRPVLYDAWDDFACTESGCENGLPVSRSTDGGHTWSVSYAATLPESGQGCSFAQFIGAQPLVNPATGILYVAAEKIEVTDPDCLGLPVTFSQMLFISRNGGQTFSGGSRIADVTPAFDFGAMRLGPGQYMRTIEFPSLAIRGGTLAVVWNDGRLTGHSHILLATRPLSGGTWNLRFITQGSGDEVQPAITSDADGWHITYYARTGRNLAVNQATSADAVDWTVQAITSRSFPGVFTIPQFDPIIAEGYMGDYLSSVSVEGRRYFAWGDNRDIVTNTLWTDGRHDPDVFFASG